ncbi:MAG: dethiobiotin synthase [Gemmatimonadaceae bacterium]|nr:dethiobiotin synthase [Chitinophagaceae bacterium]
MPDKIFVTGIGTGVGKTLVAAILAEALHAAYWKPVQAGYDDGTDSTWISDNTDTVEIFPEGFRLRLPASPHIAAREEGLRISVNDIAERIPQTNKKLIMEGAGGLLVPINENETVADLIVALGAKVVLVSRNYLGSINHSLLTAAVCKQYGIQVAGWIFNDQFMSYENEIEKWTGIPSLGSIPFTKNPDKNFILQQAAILGPGLNKSL